MQTLEPVVRELRAILAPDAARLDTRKDDASELSLDSRHLQKNQKPVFFGAMPRKKPFANVHLMPVDLQPDLLQGMSCFNVAAIDTALSAELASLTAAGFASDQAQGDV